LPVFGSTSSGFPVTGFVPSSGWSVLVSDGVVGVFDGPGLLGPGPDGPGPDGPGPDGPGPDGPGPDGPGPVSLGPVRSEPLSRSFGLGSSGRTAASGLRSARSLPEL